MTDREINEVVIIKALVYLAGQSPEVIIGAINLYEDEQLSDLGQQLDDFATTIRREHTLRSR